MNENKMWMDCFRKAVYNAHAHEDRILTVQHLINAVLDYEDIGFFPRIFSGKIARVGDKVDIPLELLEGFPTLEMTDDVSRIVSLTESEILDGRHPEVSYYISIVLALDHLYWDQRFGLILDIARKFSAPQDALEISGLTQAGTLNTVEATIEMMIGTDETEKDIADFFDMVVNENLRIHKIDWKWKKNPPPNSGFFPSVIDPKQDG